MAFDGTEWKGVDSDAYSPTSPADTALTTRLHSNERWIEQSFDRCSLATLIDGGAPLIANNAIGRPLCSTKETTWLYVPLDFDRAPTKLEVFLCCQAQTLGASDPSVEIWAYLEAEEFTLAEQVIISEDETLQTNLLIEFTEIPATRPQSATLRLTVRSLTNDGTGTSTTQADAYTRTLLHWGTGNPYPEVLPSTVQPKAGSQDILTTSRGFAQSNDIADHMLSMANSSKFGTLGDTGMELANYDASQLSGSSGGVGEGSVSTSRTSYLMVRNVTLRIGYLEQYFRQSELRSNTEELMDVNRRHVAINDRQWSRPRLLSIGEEGLMRPGTSTELWPVNYRSLWRKADRNDASTEIMRLACAPDGSMADIQINLMLCGVHLMDPPAPDPGQVFEYTLEQVMRSRTTAQWEYEARIEQYQTGTSTTLCGTSSQDYVSDHFPLMLSPYFPILQGAYFQRFWASSSDYRFTYREGQLYDGDLRLIDRLTLSVTPDGSFDPTLPFDVVVLAKPTLQDPIYRWSQSSTLGSKNPPEVFFDNQYLRILKIGHSAYLRR